MFFYRKIKQNSGAALLLILSLSAIIIPLIQSVWSDSRLDYQSQRYSMNQLQARWNAKSGMDINLLRLYLFKAVDKNVPEEFKTLFRPLLDQSWQIPFNWPLPVSEDLLESEKAVISDLTQKSLFKGSYYSYLKAEDGRLDINDLSSPLSYLRDFTYEALFNLLTAQLEKEESLKDQYSEEDLLTALNNISDWTDPDNDSQNGGLESLIEEGNLPLNRSFISVEEVKKTPGLDEALFNLMEPYITVHGAKSININYAKSEVLTALGLPSDVVSNLLLRTQSESEYYKPFSGQEEFCAFMIDQAYDFCAELMRVYKSLDMLSFSAPIAFRIHSKGQYRSQKAEWEALVYDLSSLALSYQKKRAEEIKRQDNGIEKTEIENKETGQKEKSLNFDYSYHKSLAIMYLKQ